MNDGKMRRKKKLDKYKENKIVKVKDTKKNKT